jgi:hypothetical protein
VLALEKVSVVVRVSVVMRVLDGVSELVLVLE